jgi:CubicO group peptidase (beta-lactamase class C family)
MRSRFGPVLLLSVLSATPSEGQAPQTPALARCFTKDFRSDVRGAVAGYATIAGIPGVSVGVVVRDSLVYADGVGFANRTQRIPATAETPYNVASVTKLFTATLALQLAAEGRLDLDAPVSRYLPDSVRVPTDAAGQHITVRHLLTHTAGLPPNPPNRRNQRAAGPIDPGVWDAYDVADLYRALATTTLRGRVGSSMVYSNYGYALLGHVVERVAQQPYEQLLRSRLLTPLGMTTSGITLTPAQSRRLAAFYWDRDDARAEQQVHARFGTVAGFIGLTSTVRDLSAFLRAQLGTSASRRAVVSPSVAQRMREPQVQLDTTNRTHRVDMALGWFREVALDNPSATPLLWHYGEIDGQASAVLLQPQEQRGVIVLQNLGGDTGAAATEQIGRWLLQRTGTELARCRH